MSLVKASTIMSLIASIRSYLGLLLVLIALLTISVNLSLFLIGATLASIAHTQTISLDSSSFYS